ncbi:MAG TPA: exodeoxyribonuclease VII large subunit [Burkholderiales bacterium]
MFDTPAVNASPRIISVGELNRLARELMEQHLPLTWVAGEISNFKRYDSGHCYFTLKDEAAQVDCVMFRQKAMLLGWQPGDGMQVEVRACPTLYEARGKFQLNVEVMRRAGLGALYEAFEKLKARLGREGLFNPERKRALPRFPRTIGIVTSPRGAALRDVLTTLKRRMPGIVVLIYPSPVQGEGAGGRIAHVVAKASARAECDVLIVCRGGGSIEDLWAYNDEALARAVAACSMPVISGVGHETDFTILDFVADVRAPTPTGAAQLATPDGAELCEQLKSWQQRLRRSVMRALENRMQRLDFLSKCLVHPGDRIAHQIQHLTHLANRLCGGWRRYSETQSWELRGVARELAAARPDVQSLERERVDLGRRLSDALRARMDAKASRLASIEAHLKHLNPELVLERGYSIVTNAAGNVVYDVAQIATGDEVTLSLGRGSAQAEVKSTRS